MAHQAEKDKSSESSSKSGNLTKPTDFIASVENLTRRQDAELLLPWFESVTAMPAKMWASDTIIGFGRYRYEYASGRSGEHMITGFSPRKAKLSVYILPGYRDMSDKLDRLGKHKIGKSCLYINKLSDIELDVLAEIVTDGIAYMRKNYQTWDE